MRVYLPATSTRLRQLHATGELGPAPLTAFAVTPGLREWYRDDDPEALEYAAMIEAARGSVRLIDADPVAARRRVVIAADMPDPAGDPRRPGPRRRARDALCTALGNSLGAPR